MNLSRRGLVAALAGTGVALVAATAGSGVTAASAHDSTRLTPVPSANPKVAGVTAANALSPQLRETVVAQGAMPVENPRDYATHYGYNGDGPFVPLPGTTTEASKTEPDKNVYLVLPGQTGPDRSYRYGQRFLFQGHETGEGGYVTRVNLDADAAHRVTVIATRDPDGNPLPTFDGITWDPFTRTLLLTAEHGNKGGVWQVPATYSPTAVARDISGALGRGGYEGVQLDPAGNVWLVEDTGGPSAAGKGKQPNSFVYRFVPASRGDLTKGRLQALQVTSARTGEPIVFHAGQADADALSTDQADLHTYGKTFATRWVTIHDTAVDGSDPFDANAAAKAASATPFKRPENGVFRPGTKFGEFYFTETGDTNLDSQANEGFGGFGGVFRLEQRTPGADTGRLSLAFAGTEQATGLDNLAFLTRDLLAVVEDAGDTLHSQRNALDSGFLIDVRDRSPEPLRFLAEGRDASATIDSGLLAAKVDGFQNDGDNEITGIHVSDGDPSVPGLLGAREPRPFDEHGRWRVFWTQQHGDNTTFEVLGPRR